MIPVISTIAVCLLLAAALFFAARKLWRDKKNGRTCCSGSCPGCCGCKKKP